MALRIVTGNYGLTKSLKENPTARGGLDLEFIEFASIPAAMRKMVRGLEFDVCEMALTTYLCARAANIPVIAIPVFVTRNFHHWAAFHTARSGIKRPKDLEGKAVACNRGYTVTTNFWVRAILEHEYGVDTGKITWLPTDEEHVDQYQAPPNVDYRYKGANIEDLLLKQGVPAAIGDVRSSSPEIAPLIPEARDAGFAFYRRTGIYPINHMITVNEKTLAAQPDLARRLYDAFKASKADYMKALETMKSPSAADKNARELGAVTGEPFPYGLRANRKALEAAAQFAVEQDMAPRKYAVEELFAAGTRED